jgi:hypothetical protein
MVDSLVEALGALAKDKTADGEAAREALGNFIKLYLNNKKGINNTVTWAPRGGIVDVAVRAVSGWISLAYIGGNLALQMTAIVGETSSLAPVLGGERAADGKVGSGLWGLALANARSMTAQGRKIAAKYESFIGKGALEDIFAPGKNIDERVGKSLFALLQWGRSRTLKTLLLGMMTDEEFKAGELSPERLAEIKLIAGRWMDLHGLKSIDGSTSIGAAATKFRGWMLPILRTSLQNANSLLATLNVKDGKKLTARQIGELYSIAEVSMVAGAVFMGFGFGDADEEDDSFVGQLRKKLVSEMFSLTQVFNPTMILSAGPVVSFITQFGKNVKMLLWLEEYAEGSKHEGENKGAAGLKKQLPFSAAWRNFVPKDEEK